MNAYDIAVRDLRACYGPNGIYAGLNHFKEYWARDSFFASLGSISIDDLDIAKQNLSIFMENINKYGQVPLRIGKTTAQYILYYLNIKKNGKNKPIYFIDKSKNIPVDQNSLFTISFYDYIKKSNDIEFLKKNINNIEKIIMWNLRRDIDDDSLIEEKGFCNWADSVNKKGKVLYTNVCHCHALQCASYLFEIADEKKRQEKYLEFYKKTKKRLNELFWAGEHYVDWIYEDKQYSYFSTDGNILAILWDIADKKRAKNIEEASHIFELHDVPSECVHPKYPKKYISKMIRLVGLGDYHNGLSWLWLGSISALAKHKVGKEKDAKELMKKISGIIEKYGEVFEVYNKKGEPVRRLLYKSEHPFAWSSGMYLYAYNKIIKKN